MRRPDAPLDEVARRAGIGNATMCRHFPDRRELLIAVYADEVAALCAQGEALLPDQSPKIAVSRWAGYGRPNGTRGPWARRI
jgi:AcrR family transcriptional regulator